MRKLIVVFNVLTVILVAGACVLYYFAARKLGLVRYLNFYSQNIKTAVPFDVLKYVVLAVAALVVVICLVRILKAPRHSARDIACVLFALVIVAAYGVAVLFVTHELTKADIAIVLIGGIAALLQAVNSLLACASLSRKPSGRHARM